MAHAQKPDSVFQRNGRVHLYRRGCQFGRVLAFLECGSGETGWLPTPFASFPFTSPPVRRRVPPDSVSTLPLITFVKLQGAAERTPRFGRGIASGGERIQWWGASRRTAVYVPFSVYTMAWLGELRAFIVEEFIKMAGRR